MLSINSEIQSTKDLKQFLKMSILLKGLWHATRKHEITYNAEKKQQIEKEKHSVLHPTIFLDGLDENLEKGFLKLLRKKTVS